MSSREPRAAPAELLAAFAETARDNGWRWYVFGAQAVVAYGRPRMTADVDVALDAGGRTNVELVSVLRAGGFGTRIELDAEFLAKARLLPMVHHATAMPLDFVRLEAVVTRLDEVLESQGLRERLRRLVRQTKKLLERP